MCKGCKLGLRHAQRHTVAIMPVAGVFDGVR